MRKILMIFALLVTIFTSTAFAHHEGVYVVGEIKEISGIGGCLLKEDMLSVFKKFPDAKAAALEFERLHAEKKCALFDGKARILGQVQNDVTDQNGTPWRIIHIQYFDGPTLLEAYLITWGTENIVVINK